MKAVLAATVILPVATLWMVSHSAQKEASLNLTIKKRLRDFIALAESIDFDTNVKGQTTADREQLWAAYDEACTLLSELA